MRKEKKGKKFPLGGRKKGTREDAQKQKSSEKENVEILKEEGRRKRPL